MQPLNNERDLLSAVAQMNGSFVDRVLTLLNAPSIRSLAARYRANMEKRSVRLGFNAFALVSDVYHRENFHSDILKAILDPQGDHEQGNLFLLKFLEFLGEKHSVNVRPEDYSMTKVEREPGKIDLLLYDTSSKRAVIVENKINGAPDMERQVFRYLEKTEDDWGYKCDAIIYLTLDSIKLPAMEGWSPQERSRVEGLLKPVAAFQDAQNDLYHGWIWPCIQACREKDVAHVIEQYSHLILRLGKNAMNKPLLEEFYKLMLDPKMSGAAISLQSLMGELARYRTVRILETSFRNPRPFFKAWPLNNIVVVEGIEGVKGWNPQSILKIHITSDSMDKTLVSFWDQNDSDTTLPKRILRDLGIEDWFPEIQNNNWPTRSFRFPEEESNLEDFIQQFLRKLDQYIP